ncbi:hypothetical protein FisN_14Lh277 [Fistulifera solaris]|uniref:Uncharacterized protein n=1 Tax=Fistulifera solaris TaxID=1519565 RepID=A0A1Z5J9U2_FISSO|nr:hypothetical protein FisN_14Lh277 [Fistulifera solaris]|eukprot:GAX10757.1 hypothetical protein FisN_14Lh277 [Fistulifera solaris]
MSMSSITHLLKSPKRIAQALDWHKASGSVLNVTIRKQQIDLTLASHPSLGESPESIPSIRLEHKLVNNRKRLRTQVLDELSTVVQEFRVCGLVVNWPIQKDGWCGASCGRVLHTLSELQSSTVIAEKPICLWSGHHNKSFMEDQWGRSAVYCRENPNKTVHVASKEQYDCDDAAQQSWVEFCEVNWPGLTKDGGFCEDDHNELPA